LGFAICEKDQEVNKNEEANQGRSEEMKNNAGV
jgi:hypothetical protein